MKSLTVEDLDAWNDSRKRARFINCLSGIKSAILVGTSNAQGVDNLAIFSSIFHLGADPSLMGMIVRPDVSPRHTLQNLIERKTYSLNLLPYDLRAQGHQTSARYPSDESEFETCGFSVERIRDLKVPFVKESQVKWLMELIRIVDIPENNTHMVIGRVVEVFYPEEILRDDGSLDLAATAPCLVTGLDSYHSVGKGIRYEYAKPGKKPQRLE